jgi:hypothetical protein
MSDGYIIDRVSVVFNRILLNYTAVPMPRSAVDPSPPVRYSELVGRHGQCCSLTRSKSRERIRIVGIETV